MYERLSKDVEEALLGSAFAGVEDQIDIYIELPYVIILFEGGGYDHEEEQDMIRDDIRDLREKVINVDWGDCYCFVTIKVPDRNAWKRYIKAFKETL